MMKRFLRGLTLALLALWLLGINPVRAQTELPPIEETLPSDPLGQVTGSVIFRKNGQAVRQSTEVMLHILDQNMQDKGMTHGQSGSDGRFDFSGVPFISGDQFVVMATYDGVTYYSEVEPVDMSSLRVSLDVPVYESTTDLADTRVDQLHVIFSLAEDGLETREIYVISNPGERTVKDVFQIEEDKFATFMFPLPEDADYIFFQPEGAGRFVKLDKGFADTSPLVAGAQQSQLMVSYLVPYSRSRTYSYTAPLDVAEINLLVPEQSGLSLQGEGLSGPEPMALEDGRNFRVYKLPQLPAGETIRLTITGRGAVATQIGLSFNTTFAAVLFILGALVIGVGLWSWKRSRQVEGSEGQWEPGLNSSPAPQDLDRVIDEIARLDQSHEAGRLDPQEYGRLREALRKQAKDLIEKSKQAE